MKPKLRTKTKIMNMITNSSLAIGTAIVAALLAAYGSFLRMKNISLVLTRI